MSVADIKVSLILHKRTIVMQTVGGGRDFTRFLHPISRQEMTVRLLAELTLFQQRQTQISCCSLCLRVAIKRLHQWHKYDTKNIASPNPSCTLSESGTFSNFKVKHP